MNGKDLLRAIGWGLASLLAIAAPYGLCWLLVGPPDFFIACLLLLLGVWLCTRVQKLNTRQGERQIANTVADILLVPEHEYAQVNPKDYPWLDLSFYERVTAEMQRLGLQPLVDIENLTVTHSDPSQQYFMRVFLTGDGETVAVCAHLYRGWLNAVLVNIGLVPASTQYFVEFASSTTDGDEFNTNNTGDSSTFDDPPWRDMVRTQAEASVTQVMQVHRQRVDTYLKRYPDKTLDRIRTYSDLLQAFKEEQQRLSAWRRARGGVTAEELERIGGPGLQDTAREVSAQMERDGLLGKADRAEQ